MGQDLTEVIKLLQIPPENRKPFQVLQLMQHTSDIKFFKQITEEQQSSKIHISCCQALTYKEFGVGEFIFNYGEEATFFCIILQGLVRVLIPKPPETPKAEPPKELEKLDKTQVNLGLGLLKNTIKVALKPIIMSKVEDLSPVDTSRSGYTPGSDENKIQIIKEDPINQEESTSIEVASLGAGASFGELALLRDAPRAASIQCVEPSIVAILSKSDYKRILGSFQEKQINDKIEFLYGLPAFKKWSKVSLMKLSYYFIEKEVRKGTVLYKEGEEPANVYIIKSGEFKFTKLFEIKAPEDKSIRRLFQLNKFRNRRFKELQVLIKGPGEMFGHEEILEKLTERRCSCTCISPTAEILVISEKDFQKRIANPETWKYLNDTHSIKIDWEKYRVSRLMKIEEYKDSVAFTPSDVLKPRTQRSASPTSHEAYTFHELPAPRTSTPSQESQLLNFHKEMVRLKRSIHSKRDDSLNETRSANKHYPFRDSYGGSSISRSITPGPNVMMLETRTPNYENFLPLFTTEVSPEDSAILSKLSKSRKSPIGYFNRYKEESTQANSKSRESPVFFQHSYTPTKLKPSKLIRKKFV